MPLHIEDRPRLASLCRPQLVICHCALLLKLAVHLIGLRSYMQCVSGCNAHVVLLPDTPYETFPSVWGYYPYYLVDMHK